MEKINCLRCNFRHTDNVNCTAVGGFCTAVQAAHCPLLREYLDTGLPPDQVVNAKNIIDIAFADDTSKAERIRELLKADKDGRVVVQPCKIGDKLYRVFAGEIFEHRVGSMKYFAIQGRWDIETYPFCPCVESSIGKTVFFSREEARKALAKMEDKEDG